MIRMKKNIGRFCRGPVGMLLMFLLFQAIPGRAGVEPEQLIVFVQSGHSKVDLFFQKNHLPAIRKIGESMGVPVNVVEAKKGVPKEVTITPLVIYQNHRGRSIYQGRTTTPTRIRNFIRTSRFVAQGSEKNPRENTPIWWLDRERIWAPLKVSSVTGTPPKGYDYPVFLSEALESIARGFKQFKFEKKAELDRADRGFYMDFYPWLSKDGTLYLSMAVYSQFHCKEPIFEKKKEPLIGPWKDRKKLFIQAARLMEEAVARQIQIPTSGDAFDPIKKNIKLKTWEKIGFSLPPAPVKSKVIPAGNLKISRDWTVEIPGPNEPPMIQFRFPAPLDNYSGEVKEATGDFFLPSNLVLDGTTGSIKVNTRKSITMGEPVLDEAIQGSALLYAREYPESTFVVDKVSSDGQPISYGRLTPAQVSGIFTLKRKSVPLSLVSEFEPVIGEDGTPRLLVRTSFQIDLRTFDIEGADGPAPAKYSVLLDINLKLKPKV